MTILLSLLTVSLLLCSLYFLMDFPSVISILSIHQTQTGMILHLPFHIVVLMSSLQQKETNLSCVGGRCLTLLFSEPSALVEPLSPRSNCSTLASSSLDWHCFKTIQWQDALLSERCILAPKNELFLITTSFVTFWCCQSGYEMLFRGLFMSHSIIQWLELNLFRPPSLPFPLFDLNRIYN